MKAAVAAAPLGEAKGIGRLEGGVTEYMASGLSGSVPRVARMIRRRRSEDRLDGRMQREQLLT